MVRKRTTDPRKRIVYVLLRLDRDEPCASAEKQIDEDIALASATPEKIDLIFDIVATPAQIVSGVARQCGQHILAYCDRRHPRLSARVVGITDNEDRRVGRDILISRKLGETEIDDVHLIEME